MNGQYLYFVVWGNNKTVSNISEQTMIVRVNIIISGANTISVTVTNINSFWGYVDQIASLEGMGYAYTLKNQTGIRLDVLDTTKFGKVLRTQNITTNGTWRLLQARVNNHRHRPIYGVNASEPSKIFRITYTADLAVNDTTGLYDFYNYPF